MAIAVVVVVAVVAVVDSALKLVISFFFKMFMGELFCFQFLSVFSRV